MKNKRIIIVSVAGIFVSAMSFFHFSANSSTFSDLALESIEAIANGESGGTSSCYSWIVEKEGGRVVYCLDCADMENYIAGAPYAQPDGECTRT